MNSNYTYYFEPKKISTYSNVLENLNAPRDVKRRNTEKVPNLFGQHNHPKAQNEENSGSKARFIRRNECNQNAQNNQDMPSANKFNNRTRNYNIPHIYSLSSKKESTQKKKENSNVNIDAIKLKFGLIDLISNNGSNNGSSKVKSNRDNISYYSNISKNRAKIESDSVKEIIEKVANDAVAKIANENKKYLTDINNTFDKFLKELKTQTDINNTFDKFLKELKTQNTSFLGSLNSLFSKYFKKQK